MIEFRYIEKPDYADPLGHPPVTRYLQYRMWEVFVPSMKNVRDWAEMGAEQTELHKEVRAYLEDSFHVRWTDWRDIPLIPEWDWKEDKPASPADAPNGKEDGKEKGEDAGLDVYRAGETEPVETPLGMELRLLRRIETLIRANDNLVAEIATIRANAGSRIPPGVAGAAKSIS